MDKAVTVKVYHGYGHTQNLVVFGHVFKRKSVPADNLKNRLWVNVINLLKLFRLETYPFVNVRLNFFGEYYYDKAEADGFFKFEWKGKTEVAAGWHEVTVDVLDNNENIIAEGKGKVFVPHVTQYAFISDIDDTVIHSYSASIWRRLKILLTKNAGTRTVFPNVAHYYKKLSLAHTAPDQPNPFFYVSSSEWNLYDYLIEVFKTNHLPDGIFLLNTIKQLKDFFSTGKTGHQGKLLRVMRIIDAFPKQQFVFLGDNSQQDPQIYATIVERYPKNIKAVYIRNVRKSRFEATKSLLEDINDQNISTCLFNHTCEAQKHAEEIGLL